jgi:hypothetical protein
MRVFALLVVLSCALACQQIANPPVQDQQTFSASADSMRKVAIVPFTARVGVVREGAGVTDEEVANLVATFAAEALRAEGVSVVPPSDVAAAFLNEGRAVPRRDVRRATEVVAADFGATSVLMGEVIRWRERKGEALGAEHPASVAYLMKLHEIPSGRILWSSRFDHTQRTITADPLLARKYPGGGTRFLTAAELTRWAMSDAAGSLVEGQWRTSK